MQGLGFSLREIKQLIELRSRKVEACEAVRELLQEKLSQIHAKMTELETLKSELTADLHKCDNELKHRQRHAPSACPVLKEVSTNESRGSVRSRLPESPAGHGARSKGARV
jgi:chromosome segregation ATPase